MVDKDKEKTKDFVSWPGMWTGEKCLLDSITIGGFFPQV